MLYKQCKPSLNFNLIYKTQTTDHRITGGVGGYMFFSCFTCVSSHISKPSQDYECMNAAMNAIYSLHEPNV